MDDKTPEKVAFVKQAACKVSNLLNRLEQEAEAKGIHLWFEGDENDIACGSGHGTDFYIKFYGNTGWVVE